MRELVVPSAPRWCRREHSLCLERALRRRNLASCPPFAVWQPRSLPRRTLTALQEGYATASNQRRSVIAFEPSRRPRPASACRLGNRQKSLFRPTPRQSPIRRIDRPCQKPGRYPNDSLGILCWCRLISTLAVPFNDVVIERSQIPPVVTHIGSALQHCTSMGDTRLWQYCDDPGGRATAALDLHRQGDNRGACWRKAIRMSDVFQPVKTCTEYDAMHFE